MTTVILVSIGILLAALATMMVMFFGGGSLSHGADRAHAEILENAGMNVASAADLFRATVGHSPTSMADLLDAGGMYLKQAPETGPAASGTGTIASDGTDIVYTIGGVGQAACAAVNADFGNDATLASRGSLRHGCTSSGGEGTFFAVL